MMVQEAPRITGVATTEAEDARPRTAKDIVDGVFALAERLRILESAPDATLGRWELEEILDLPALREAGRFTDGANVVILREILNQEVVTIMNNEQKRGATIVILGRRQYSLAASYIYNGKKIGVDAQLGNRGFLTPNQITVRQ